VPSPPYIDRILEAIRSEARARGSAAAVGSYSTELGAPRAAATSHGLPRLDVRHVGDFLALPLDVFIDYAYRELLGRPADGGGAAHYQRALLASRLTRIEVLGRLRFSAEGRRRAAALPGLVPAFALALLYRLPVAGIVAALAARVLRLPAHMQDRAALEAASVASGSWMKR
jgi:hypothetical protein